MEDLSAAENCNRRLRAPAFYGRVKYNVPVKANAMKKMDHGCCTSDRSELSELSSRPGDSTHQSSTRRELLVNVRTRIHERNRQTDYIYDEKGRTGS